MKSPDWQLQNRPDYGSRTDYLAFSNETAAHHVTSRVKPSVEYWVHPKKGIFNREAQMKGRAYKCPLELFNTWNGVFRGMWDHGGRNFSLGNFAILMALEYVGRRLCLVGFDNLMAPDSGEYHKADRGKWTTGHNWKAENEFFHMLIEHYKADFVTELWDSATK